MTPLTSARFCYCSDIVRKKAVCALHRFYQLDQSSISNMGDKVRRALCDKDPSVMAASLCLLHDLIRDNPNTYKDLVSSFVSILKQITEHRLPRTCSSDKCASLRLLTIHNVSFLLFCRRVRLPPPARAVDPDAPVEDPGDGRKGRPGCV